MIPYVHTSRSPIRNLPKLLEAYHSRGGSIVEFKQVVSCLIVSQKSGRYVWVPPNGSRFLRSLPDTIATLLFGWWSLFGFFWTIEVLIWNLSGGRDATDELLEATRGGDVALAQQALDHELRARRQQSVRAVLQFVGIVGGIVLVFWVVAKISDWSTRRSAARAVAAKEVKPRPTVIATTNNNMVAAETNLAAAARPAQALRLQAIFYSNNGRSRAIISGKTISVGESASGYKVLAIERQTVTVQSANGEKVVLQPGGRD